MLEIQFFQIVSFKLSFFPSSCSRNPESSLFRLPKNDQVRKRLLRDLGFPETLRTFQDFRICSQHFTEDSIEAKGEFLNLVNLNGLNNCKTSLH